MLVAKDVLVEKLCTFQARKIFQNGARLGPADNLFFGRKAGAGPDRQVEARGKYRDTESAGITEDCPWGGGSADPAGILRK